MENEHSLLYKETRKQYITNKENNIKLVEDIHELNEKIKQIENAAKNEHKLNDVLEDSIRMESD